MTGSTRRAADAAMLLESPLGPSESERLESPQPTCGYPALSSEPFTKPTARAGFTCSALGDRHQLRGHRLSFLDGRHPGHESPDSPTVR